MASASAKSSKNEPAPCVLCSNKYHRARPSFCQCQHCSIPLCFDCMKEHHEELLQDVEQISHQYNELQQLIQNKQMMVVEETAKSIEGVHRYFDAHIEQLREIQKKTIVNMELEKQNAQDHMRKVDADLRLIGGEIQGLAKESVVQTGKMKIVSTKLKEIEEHLNRYQVIRTENGTDIQPDISIKFDCPPVEIETAPSSDMEINETCQTQLQQPLPNITFSGIFGPLPVVPKPLTNSTEKKSSKKNDSSDCSDSDNNDDSSDTTHVDTSDDVDRMASDGENILYTTYYDDESDRIAYCCLEDDDDDEDEHRSWNRSRIVDMIWWNSIKKFVCATKEGIYTVAYANKKFKITEVIHGKWSFVRVAANATHLYLWISSEKKNIRGIEVYSNEFQSVRKIDFEKYRNEPFINESVGFCVTDKLIASIYTQMQNNSKIVEVTFCDMNMNKSNSITLGKCNRETEIRTNGEDRFFITTGHRSFHIVSSGGRKETTELEKNGKWVSVLDDEHVAVSNGRSDIQLVPYSILDGLTLFRSK